MHIKFPWIETEGSQIQIRTGTQACRIMRTLNTWINYLGWASEFATIFKWKCYSGIHISVKTLKCLKWKVITEFHKGRILFMSIQRDQTQIHIKAPSYNICILTLPW